MGIKTRDSFKGLSWETDFDTETGIFLATTSGVLTVANLNAFTGTVVPIAYSHGTQGILIDHSLAKFKLSIFEIYDRPSKAENLGVKRQSPVALVFRPDLMSDPEFGETLFVNRGFNYQVFPSREEARVWLLKYHEPQTPPMNSESRTAT
jgi:hypothetical protein